MDAGSFHAALVVLPGASASLWQHLIPADAAVSAGRLVIALPQAPGAAHQQQAAMMAPPQWDSSAFARFVLADEGAGGAARAALLREIPGAVAAEARVLVALSVWGDLKDVRRVTSVFQSLL